jgi:hypothetical protein
MPTYSTVIPDIFSNAKEDTKYSYSTFKLNRDLYIKIDAPKVVTTSSKFEFGKDEVILFNIVVL